MSVFKKYLRTAIAEMAEYEYNTDMTGISVSQVDVLGGSPKIGDMIARNPANHDDKWLVSKEYFEANFAEYVEPIIEAVNYEPEKPVKDIRVGGC